MGFKLGDGAATCKKLACRDLYVDLAAAPGLLSTSGPSYKIPN
jgi:hypothetical protein